MHTLLLLLSTALAGTLHVQSEAPVSYRVDGESVARMVVNTTIEDLQYGHHTVEAVDALGEVLASADILIDNTPVFLRYQDHSLDKLDPMKMSLAELGIDTPTITDEDFLLLRRNLAKRSDKKRYKVLMASVEDNWFEMRHVDELLKAFDSLAYRVAAAVKLAEKTVDPQKFAAIEDHFPPGEYLDRARLAFLGQSD